MQILNQDQILKKVKRLAIEILENNHLEKEIQLIGINNTGMKFAEILQARLQEISAINFPLAHIKINPRNPLDPAVALNMQAENLEDKVVILIDDVANSGRTLFYSCIPIMKVLPKKLETVVLVDRTHKSFPIKVDYVGTSLATTLQEDISVNLISAEEMTVELK